MKGLEKINERTINDFFHRYREFFCHALEGEADMEQGVSSYASSFIAASPAGVMAGENNNELKEVLRQGFEYYRKIGTKDMAIRNIHISPIDDFHCVAHIGWRATYTRKNQPDVIIDFDVHYLVQQQNEGPKIFGWVSGDEQATLKKNGII